MSSHVEPCRTLWQVVVVTDHVARALFRVSPGAYVEERTRLAKAAKAARNKACAPLANAAVYIWHCTATGLYSMYSSGITGENYLRGVQITNSSGQVTFTTIFPGCYAGRMPHMHFEVYPSLASATGAANKVKTSQIAFPTATCNEVYATSGYGNSAANLSAISFASDNVFSDGTELQMASISGTTSNGYSASLVVGIAS